MLPHMDSSTRGYDDSINITSVEHDEGTGILTISYDSSFAQGVDVYTSADLIRWVADGTEAAIGNDLTLQRTSSVPGRFYVLVPRGQVFPIP